MDSPQASSGFRAQFLLLALRALYGHDTADPIFPIRLAIHDARHGRTVMEFTEREYRELTAGADAPEPDTPALPVPVASASVAHPLGQLHRKILKVVWSGESPVAPKQVAKAVGTGDNSYFRAIVTFLTREGYLRRTPDGLVRGPRTPPGEQP
jgi:hypothetical protein